MFSMEALRTALIESARILDISPQGAAFKDALEIGLIALDSGFDLEVALDFARKALLEAVPVWAA